MNNKFLLLLVILSCFFSVSFAGAKKDFIAAVKEQCENKKIKASRGRQGNVMKWKTCTSQTITIDGCELTCEDKSSKIGK